MALGAQSFNPNKINGHFIKTLIRVRYLVSFIPKCYIKAFGFIIYLVFIYLIYPIFFSFLIAAIELI